MAAGTGDTMPHPRRLVITGALCDVPTPSFVQNPVLFGMANSSKLVYLRITQLVKF